jgi:carbon storage regulator
MQLRKDRAKRANGNLSFDLSIINREKTMLVLSRKLGERIVVGENIRITVVKIDRNQIRIGIEAPGDIPVYREEIAPQRFTLESRTSEAVLSH